MNQEPTTDSPDTDWPDPGDLRVAMARVIDDHYRPDVGITHHPMPGSAPGWPSGRSLIVADRLLYVVGVALTTKSAIWSMAEAIHHAQVMDILSGVQPTPVTPDHNTTDERAATMAIQRAGRAIGIPVAPLGDRGSGDQ